MGTAPLALLAIVAAGCSRGAEPVDCEQAPVVSQDVLAHQRAKDEQVIRALAEAGSNMSKPHSLEHHFVCPSREAAGPVVAWGKASGYQSSEVIDDEFEGRRYVYFDLVMSTVPTIAEVTMHTSAMLEIAARHGVEYDGWGCEVVE